MPVRQLPVLDKSGFTYIDFGPFTKNKGRIQKFKETGDSRYNVGTELGSVGTARSTKFDCENNLEL